MGNENLHYSTCCCGTEDYMHEANVRFHDEMETFDHHFT